MIVDRIGVLFAILWLFVGFFAVRWLARRYFTQPRRATVFAAGVVAAFAAGALWPLGDHGGQFQPTAASVPAAGSAPVGAAPPTTARNVSSVCRKAHLGQAKTRAVVDVVDLIHAGQLTTMPAHFAAEPADTLFIAGWAVDPASPVPAAAVCLVIDGLLQPQATALYGATRADVAAALGSTNLTESGYNLQLPVRTMASGQHHVAIAVVLANGSVGVVQSDAVVFVQ